MKPERNIRELYNELYSLLEQMAQLLADDKITADKFMERTDRIAEWITSLRWVLDEEEDDILIREHIWDVEELLKEILER